MDNLQENTSVARHKDEVPISSKVHEASLYFNIGQTKLRALTRDDRCPYVLYCGSKRLIKREQFKNYLDKQFSI